MGQLRHDYPKFQAFDTTIAVMVPNGPRMIERYLRTNPTPFPILSDKGAGVAGQYLQIKQFFSLGTSSVFLVDSTGRLIDTYYAKLMIEEPDNHEPLTVLASPGDKDAA